MNAYDSTNIKGRISSKINLAMALVILLIDIFDNSLNLYYS